MENLEKRILALDTLQQVGELLSEVLKVKDLEICDLKNKLKSLRQATSYYREYKALAEDGEVWVNTYSQDCDGVDSYGSFVCKTIEEYIESENSFAESVEGSYSWEIVSKENARSEDDCGTYGQGWDIN